MKGLELSRRYYQEVGEPALRARFGDRVSRFAAGLVGEGSECFGYDDSISADHDYGPGFCLWLTPEDYETVGKEAQAVYDSLPGEFWASPPEGRLPPQASGWAYGRFPTFTPGLWGPFSPRRAPWSGSVCGRTSWPRR